MYVIRKAEIPDLPDIHQIQNIDFREMVFLDPLPPCEKFIYDTADRMQSDREYYYVLEDGRAMIGFIRLLAKGNDWEALTWGKWLNTLAYACNVVAFDMLKLPKLVFAVRQENKRVMHLYQKFEFRRTGQELVMYRPHVLGYVKTSNLIYYEITSEEFREKSEFLRKQSLQLTFR